jgi:hypothetical protein
MFYHALERIQVSTFSHLLHQCSHLILSHKEAAVNTSAAFRTDVHEAGRECLPEDSEGLVHVVLRRQSRGGVAYEDLLGIVLAEAVSRLPDRLRQVIVVAYGSHSSLYLVSRLVAEARWECAYTGSGDMPASPLPGKGGSGWAISRRQT